MKDGYSCDTVRKMVREGVSKELIMEITGCSERTYNREKECYERMFSDKDEPKKKKPRYIRTVSGLMYLR